MHLWRYVQPWSCFNSCLHVLHRCDAVAHVTWTLFLIWGLLAAFQLAKRKLPVMMLRCRRKYLFDVDSGEPFPVPFDYEDPPQPAPEPEPEPLVLTGGLQLLCLQCSSLRAVLYSCLCAYSARSYRGTPNWLDKLYHGCASSAACCRVATAH